MTLYRKPSRQQRKFFMRIYYLAGILLSITATLAACGEAPPVTCTISTNRDLKMGIQKTANFVSGTNCDEIRKLAEEGKPLVGMISENNSGAPAKPVETPKPLAFDTPFVSGQKTQELIPTTDKESRIQELEKKIDVDAKQARDPFTSTIINPVPKLETLLIKPKAPPKLKPAIVVRTNPKRSIVAPPPPPDTSAAQGTAVTGTVEIGGTVYAIIKAAGEANSRNVRAGQTISNGKVLVKRIDTNSEPPIIVLQQNGVEVLRAVGAPVIAANTTQTGANPEAPATGNSPTAPSTPPISIPPLIPAQ